MQHFKYTNRIDEASRTQQITLAGALEGLEAIMFGKTMLDSAAHPATRCAIDARQLDRIDLTGVNILVQIWRHFESNQVPVQFILGDSPRVTTLLRLTKFDGILPIRS